ncbi:putative UPF0481 protein [Iris pallida]|uniref:UPF0481 protein n=1 Tax=Iris pallida TaxID=29817 RepID=A0AAX6IAH2_IRIPA|nr:putative UPF0481 protein [Iris pallida]
MLVIDASFLIEFLQIHSANSTQVLARSVPKRIENERTKIFFNMMLRDIMMLENQMPLFLLRELLGLQFETKELAADELARALAVFVKEVSPIKYSMENFPLVDDVASHAHLLDLLYCVVVPKAAGTGENIIAEEENGEGEREGRAKELVDDVLGADSTGVVKKAFTWVWTSFLSGSNRGPMRIVKRVVAAKPVRLVVKFPWKVVSALPIFSIVKQPVKSCFNQLVGGGKAKSDDDGTGGAHVDKPALAEEIAIPSVAELCAAGIQFQPRRGDVTTVEFDAKTATVYLPVVTLDVNTEVILRNLVAYEASAVSGPLVFTRYTELMNGIIDTEEDVRMLRKRGVVVNRMKSDGEAAALWNGMSKSVRLTNVGFLDTVIRDVNKYYRSRWRVKSREFMKKFVFDSWQVLTLLAAALLLFLTCVQAFCSVYSCNSNMAKFSSDSFINFA